MEYLQNNSICKHVGYCILFLYTVCLYTTQTQAKSIDTAWLNKTDLHAQDIIKTNPDSSATLFLSILKKSEQYQFNPGKSIAHLGLGYTEAAKEQYAKALEHFKASLSLASPNYKPENIAIIYNNIAACLQILSEYEEAVKAYRQAIDYSQKYPSQKFPTATITTNYGMLLSKLGQYETAIAYFEEAIDYFKEKENYEQVSWLYNNIGLAKQRPKNYQQSIPYFDSAIHFAHISKNYQKLYEALTNKGTVFLYLKNGSEALNILLQAQQVAFQYKIDVRSQNVALANIGSAYLLTGNHQLAEQYLTKALSTPNTMPKERTYLLSQLAELYEYTGNYKKSVHFLKLFHQLKDSIENENIKLNVTALETKYKTAEKEKQLYESKLKLNEKEKSITRKNIWILGISLSSIIVFITIIWQYQLKNRKLKAQQEIEHLKGIIEGEEKERSRLAHDLHDGVNSKIASVRMIFKNLQNTPKTFSKEIDIINTALEETSNEVRRVAHNLTPEDLLLKGLKKTVTDFATNLTKGSAIQTDIQIYGSYDDVNINIQLTIYRIVQELLHNIIKHAKAKMITLLINKTENDITIIVEDDGIGFNENKTPEQKEGLGLKNVRDRVKVFNGNLNIDSVRGKGTHIEIIFPVMSENYS